MSAFTLSWGDLKHLAASTGRVVRPPKNATCNFRMMSIVLDTYVAWQVVHIQVGDVTCTHLGARLWEALLQSH
jgi:hypothetical protein